MFAFKSSPTYQAFAHVTKPTPTWLSTSEPSALDIEIVRLQAELLPILIDRFFNNSPAFHLDQFTDIIFRGMLLTSMCQANAEESECEPTPNYLNLFSFDITPIQFYVGYHYRDYDSLGLSTALCHDLGQVALGIAEHGLLKFLENGYLDLFADSLTSKFLEESLYS
jgi:hypothetical protein